MTSRIIKIAIQRESDIVVVRQRARQISASLGFSQQDQVRIATAVSELARHVSNSSAGGHAEFALDSTVGASALAIAIQSDGGGDPRNPAPAASNGFDDALISAQRLMDGCNIEGDSQSGAATRIILFKRLPAGTQFSRNEIAELAGRLAASPVANTFAEVQLQNQELLVTLAELREKQDSLLALTQELEDTNRGVVALYAEIEEKAERLRAADELKSRFLSNTSHELRTPLSSIRALSRLLLDRIDGDLTVEQEKQVRFIDKAAFDLSELVNDLLDLAKIESGKIEVQATVFSVANLFSALRGMMRPLAVNPEVELIVDDPAADLEMYSDEGKVSQILRNFLSNALKFTEHGEVRMSVQHDAQTGMLRMTVADTGIGIAPENLQFVFEEFSQVENPLQKKVKGTGLGLPLCRRLAVLLGGQVELASEPGVGSRFSLVLPLSYVAPEPGDADTAPAEATRNRHG